MTTGIRHESHLERTKAISVILIFLALLAVPAIWIGKSHMEARAYNRLTGGNATTLDAMFAELRVNGTERNNP